MARNFRIKTENNNKHMLCLKLFGDFDGASASQLLYLLKRKVRKVNKVILDTSGLRHVNTFGIDVLLPGIRQLNRVRSEIAFTGKYKMEFSPGDRRF